MTKAPSDHQVWLRDWRRRFAAAPRDRDVLTDHCEELIAFFYEFSPIRIDYRSSRYQMRALVKQGEALSPECAAGCIRDVVRTWLYLQAVHAAIETARERFGEPVYVVYAGTGPFAPLLLPVLAEYGPEQVQATLIDVFPEAVQSLQAILQATGLADRVCELARGDATSLQLKRPGHVLILETLRQALETEPQVALTRALAPQLAAGGILVPERVEVRLELLDLPAYFPPGGPPNRNAERLDLGCVIDLSLETLPQLEAAIAPGPSVAPAENDGPNVEVLRAGSFLIPDYENSDFEPVLQTRIQLAPGLALEEGESGLTVPLHLRRLPSAYPGDRLELELVLAERPRIDGRLHTPRRQGLPGLDPRMVHAPRPRS